MFKVYDIVDYKFSPSISIDMQNKIIEDCKMSAKTDDTKKVVELLGSATADDKHIVIAVYEILYNLYLENITLDEIVAYAKSNGYDLAYETLVKYTSDKSGYGSVLNIAYTLLALPISGAAVLVPKTIRAVKEEIMPRLTEFWGSLKTIKLSDLNSEEYIRELGFAWLAISNLVGIAFVWGITKLTSITPYGSERITGIFTGDASTEENRPIKTEDLVIKYSQGNDIQVGNSRKSDPIYAIRPNALSLYENDDLTKDVYKYITDGHYSFWQFSNNSIFYDMIVALINSAVRRKPFSNTTLPITASEVYMPQLSGKPFINNEYNEFAKWAINTSQEISEISETKLNLEAPALYTAVGWFFRNMYDDLTDINHMNNRLERIFAEVKENKIFSVINMVLENEANKVANAGINIVNTIKRGIETIFGTLGDDIPSKPVANESAIQLLVEAFKKQMEIFKNGLLYVPNYKKPNSVILYTYERLVDEFAEYNVSDFRTIELFNRLQFLIGFIKVLDVEVYNEETNATEKWFPEKYDRLLELYRDIKIEKRSFEDIYKEIYIDTCKELAEAGYVLNNGGKLLWDIT